MLHNCCHSKTKPTPDEICHDFRRILRERAMNHSQFYRYLSSSTKANKLTKKADIICHSNKDCFPDIDTNKIDEFTPFDTNSDGNSLVATSLAPMVTYQIFDDEVNTNHQHEIIDVSEVSQNYNKPNKWNDDIDPPAVASDISSEEEPLNKLHHPASLLLSTHIVDSANDKIADPTWPQAKDSVDLNTPPNKPSTSSEFPGKANFFNGGGGVVNTGGIVTSVSALTDDTCIHFADNDKKSSVSLLSPSTSSKAATTTASSTTSSVIVATTAINNNKTCEQHGSNHSNYLTFVRGTSSDCCSPKNHPPHHSHQQCQCDKFCCQYNCDCVGEKRELCGGKVESLNKLTCISSGPVKEAAKFSWLGEVVEEAFEGGLFANRNLGCVKENCRCDLKTKIYDSTDTLVEELSEDIVEPLDKSLSSKRNNEDADSVVWSDINSELGNLNSDDFGGYVYDSDDCYNCLTPTNSFLDSSLVAVKYSVITNTLSLESSSELVHQPRKIQQYYNFPCVDKLVKMYTKLLQDKKCEMNSESSPAEKKTKTGTSIGECEMKSIEGLQIKDERVADMNRSSPLSDEGCALASSPYSSDLEDNDSELAGGSQRLKRKEKVLRSSSSDSALDLDDETPMEPPPNMNTGRRMTLTVTDIPLRPALLPVPEPHSLPDSTIPIDQTPSPPAVQANIPSKVILEERIVEISDDKFTVGSNSRRESAQSTLSDFNPIECGAVRFVRTPSVVVSDYSDDVLCGVTLEEIEYFRQHRMRRRSSAERDDACSDVSAASSCSNLDYCGSTISGLDGSEYYMNGERVSIDRKISDCSTCSTVSGDDDDENSGYGAQEQDYVGDDQQQKEEEQRLKRERKKIQVKARHPKFIN